MLSLCKICKCNCPPDNDYLILDISGVAYHMYKDIVHARSDGLIEYLWSLKTDENSTLPPGVYRTQQSNRYFLPRSPVLFEVILQYYVTGKVHPPAGLCQKVVDEELKFWKINAQKVACKQCSFQLVLLNECIAEDNETNEDVNNDIKNSNWQRFKRKMWFIFNKPRSSFGAMVYAIITSLFVFISIVNLIVSSVPELHLCPEKGTEIFTSSETDKIGETLEIDLTDFNDTINRNHTNATTISFKPDGVLRFFSNCLGMQKFEIVDMLCLCWFTLELLGRFVVSPNRNKFIRSPVNIIDFLASFPFYLEVLLWLFGFSDEAVNYTLMLCFRTLRSITVLRVLKLGRYSRDLIVLALTIREAKNELLTLLLFLTVETLIYACIVFQLEANEPNTRYTSIPASIWWSVTTVTTVGYGDMYPTTTAGKIIGSVACVTGMVLVAMPISALVDKFTKVYHRNHIISH